MNYLVAALAVLSALILTGAAVSVFAVYRVQALMRKVREPVPPPEIEPAPVHDTELRSAVEALAAQVNELRMSSVGEAFDPAEPRPGLNLSKRSQALRLHRRGDSPEQIAASLQAPRQEVDLLLKVHRIVLNRVQTA